MRVCGIEIKGSEALLAVVEQVGEEYRLIEIETKRIALKDDENNKQVQSFHSLFQAFARENDIGKIAIKKRMKTGGFAGGAVTFKIEALIQMIEDVEVVLIAGPTIAAAERKQAIEVPQDLNKYQSDAFKTAIAAIRKG